jgi:hypothetical protein
MPKIHAAIGVRMHSGWGALIALSNGPSGLQVLHRIKILTIDHHAPGAKQPYHYAATLSLDAAQQHLDLCATASRGLAISALRDVAQQLEQHNYRLVGLALLLASARPLPSLPEILAAHPLIHTAEGEFFRRSIRDACYHLRIPVTGFKERALPGHAKAAFGSGANRVQRQIASLGKSLGPPWTADQKSAALAASLLLASKPHPRPS